MKMVVPKKWLPKLADESNNKKTHILHTYHKQQSTITLNYKNKEKNKTTHIQTHTHQHLKLTHKINLQINTNNNNNKKYKMKKNHQLEHPIKEEMIKFTFITE